MKITRISHLKDHGVYQNFSWKSCSPPLPDFGRYNLIYGWNGTGKTTLSRLFRALERGRSQKIGETMLRIDDKDVKGEEFTQPNPQVRVFNRDFIQDNVLRTEDRGMKPILVLGADNVEKQKKMEELRKEFEDVKSKLNSAEDKKEGTTKDFEKFCIQKAQGIKRSFRSNGDSSYNNYNKSRFKDEAIEMSLTYNSVNYRLIESKRNELLSQYQEKLKEKVRILDFPISDFKLVMNQVSELIGKTITSKAIDSLKNNAILASWVQEGWKLHRNENTKVCKFCGQQLLKQRLVELEEHFNAEYEDFITQVNSKVDKLKKMMSDLERFKSELPDERILYDCYRNTFQDVKGELISALSQLKKFLNAVMQDLEDKGGNPFKSVKLDITNSEASQVQATIDNLNEIIENHNQDSDNFETRRRNAEKHLVNDMIAEDLEGDNGFVHLKEAVGAANRDVEILKENINHLKVKISKLEDEITDHRQLAKELNEDLQNYLGHQGD